MKKLLLRIEPEVWKKFRIWCEDRGIPTTGRNAQLGATISRIIDKHISKTGDEKERSTPKDKILKLKQVLDRNILPKRSAYAPADYVNAIITQTLYITTPHLIRNYAALCGYTYDRKRKAYKVPLKSPKQDTLPVSCIRCGENIEPDSVITIADRPHHVRCYLQAIQSKQSKN